MLDKRIILFGSRALSLGRLMVFDRGSHLRKRVRPPPEELKHRNYNILQAKGADSILDDFVVVQVALRPSS